MYHKLESGYLYEDWNNDGVQDARLKPKAYFPRNGEIWHDNSWVKVLGVPVASNYGKSDDTKPVFAYKDPLQVDGENGYFWDGIQWNIGSMPSAFLGGAVKLPGLWPVPEGNRLEDFIDQSGGLEQWAVSLRIERAGEVIYESDISRQERLSGKLKTDFGVLPGDLIIVESRVH